MITFIVALSAVIVSLNKKVSYEGLLAGVGGGG